MVRSIKLYKSFDIKNHHKKSIILIGNFDGLHLGHQKLFKLANEYKKKFYSKTGVLIDNESIQKIKTDINKTKNMYLSNNLESLIIKI